jgi:ABC-type multidrug transport system fused ATPase/permease subunit
LTKLFSIILIFGKSYVIVHTLIAFNKNIHSTLLHRLLHAPINLFHNIVTKSHIINRFSKDIGNSIKYFWSLNSIIIVLFHIINGLFISVFLFKKIIFIIPFLILLDYYLYKYYIKSAKGLNTLEIYTRVPILSIVKETLSGITSIRAYRYKEIFQNIYHKRLHDFYRVLVYQVGCSSWFALNIDLVSFIFLFLILIFIWLFKDKIGGGPLGIALNYVLKLIEHTYNFFDHLNKNERMSTSMESRDAYTHIVQEAPLKLKSDDMLIKNNFPKLGKIEFVNYNVRYRPDTKIVLKDLNILIHPKEKIGIVGRTGSGKTTLCLCLFRILEATSGKILIDDIDISLIGLSLLRRIITIIPQDPTLIEGSLRQNLDPLGQFDNKSMIESLKSIGMNKILKKDGLNFMVKENGANLSAGERQLICIARAMIRKSKIILMDEATSSIDYDTEKLIQNTILNTLKDSTVITIAHRIKTILEYDRILVFDQGTIIEQGSPKKLIEKKGHFFNLFSESML